MNACEGMHAHAKVAGVHVCHSNGDLRERPPKRSPAADDLVTLPAAVNADKAEAKYENGVLTLILPKAGEALPKQIRIGGQVTKSLYQFSMQSPDKPELYAEAQALEREIAKIPLAW